MSNCIINIAMLRHNGDGFVAVPYRSASADSEVMLS